VHLLYGTAAGGAHCGAEPRRAGGLGARTLRQITDYMQDHLHEDVTLDRLAAEVHISKYHLLRSFTEATGLTPHRYLTDLRVARAASMLLTTDRSVLEISLAYHAVGAAGPRVAAGDRDGRKPHDAAQLDQAEDLREVQTPRFGADARRVCRGPRRPLPHRGTRGGAGRQALAVGGRAVGQDTAREVGQAQPGPGGEGVVGREGDQSGLGQQRLGVHAAVVEGGRQQGDVRAAVAQRRQLLVPPAEQQFHRRGPCREPDRRGGHRRVQDQGRSAVECAETLPGSSVPRPHMPQYVVLA
jgi:AraC-like DNA-binding protein